MRAVWIGVAINHKEYRDRIRKICKKLKKFQIYLRKIFFEPFFGKSYFETDAEYTRFKGVVELENDKIDRFNTRLSSNQAAMGFSVSYFLMKFFVWSFIKKKDDNFFIKSAYSIFKDDGELENSVIDRFMHFSSQINLQ